MRHRGSRGRQERRGGVVESTGVVSRGSGPVIMRRSDERPVRRGGGAGMVKLVVLLAVAGAAFWTLATYRHALVESVPAAYPILKALGFEVEEPAGYGLKITSRADRMQDENQRWIVYVRGHITNTLDRRTSVPRLRITVRASNSRPLVWSIEPELSSVAPGQQINFQSRYSTRFALRDVRARVTFEKR